MKKETLAAGSAPARQESRYFIQKRALRPCIDAFCRGKAASYSLLQSGG